MALPHATRDAWLIISARGVRQFAYGQVAVVLAVVLSREGFTPAAIGTVITVSLVGDFCGTALIGRFADHWGRRRTLFFLALLMALTGLIFGLSSSYPLLLMAAFFGTLGTSASETAPFLPLEQAMRPQTLPVTAQRTSWFARYNLVASLAGALGGLAAALPDLLTQLGVTTSHGLQASFGLYVVLALSVAFLIQQLSPSVEAFPTYRVGPSAPWWRQFLPQSRAIVVRLAALFTVDALAGGLVGQTLLALFFHLRFGVPLAGLGVLFFGTNLLWE